MSQVILPKKIRSSANDRTTDRIESDKRVSQSFWALEQDDVETDVGLDDRMRLIRSHGNFSLAYSVAVQPVLKHFGDGNGFIAYRQRWGITMALGDPVIESNSAADLLHEFTKKFKKPSFCQISRSTASLLAKQGYFCNRMGVDTTLALPEYTFSGKSKEWLRYAFNWVHKRDYAVRECSIDDLEVGQIEALSEAWRKTRTVKRKEVRFLNRPIVLHDEPDVRKFFLFDDQQRMLAFIFLDPIYQNQEIVGYVTAFKRRHPDAPPYAEHALMKAIIEQLKTEQVSQLNLGLSPLTQVQSDEFRSSWLTRTIFHRGFRSRIINHYFYHLRGHADYKRRFRGQEEPLYYASPTRYDPLRLMALIGLCGVA